MQGEAGETPAKAPRREDWPLNLWGFARLIAPRRCCAYLAWYDAGPATRLSAAAMRRVELETLLYQPGADRFNWPLHATPVYERRAARLRSNARHLIYAVLPHLVRKALRSGDYLTTGVGPDGQRVEIGLDDLAGLTVDLGTDRLVGGVIAFDRVSIRPRSPDNAQSAPTFVPAGTEQVRSGRIVLVPEGMIALDAAVEETVRALFGDALVAELTEDEVKAAVAGDHSRTEAWQNAIDRLLGALQSGDLTALAVQPAQDRRVRLPRAYWQLWIAEWRPFRTGRVDIVATDRDVPRELRDIAGWPCAIDQPSLRHWISNLKIQSRLAPPSPELTSELPAWVPLHRTAAERARLEACPIKSAQRAIIKAAGEGVLPVRGRLATDVAYRSEAAVIPAERFHPPGKSDGYGGVIDWHDGNVGNVAPELSFSGISGKLRYLDLEVEEGPFKRWLLLTKTKPFKLPHRFVGMAEAFTRLRRRIKRDEKREAPDAEIAQIIVEHARRRRLQIWWMDHTEGTAPLFSGGWDSDALPAGLSPEELILNGYISGNALVFIRREFAAWLEDRPEEANPPPKLLSERAAASIPTIAREWSREPGAETEEKIAERLWRAFFEGEFRLQIEEGKSATFDREQFAVLTELNPPDPKQATIPIRPARPDDPEFYYRAFAAWAAQDFPGMDTTIRLASVEKYLLPRAALAEWCKRAGQRMPRFWRSGTNTSPRAAVTGLPKKRPPAARDLRSWYKQRVRDFKKIGKQPSREDDYQDANRQFEARVTHDVIAPLRRELAPEWTEKGRRSTKSEKKKSEM
jgi:hypothetical protein